jgi:hypothetical protein
MKKQASESPEVTWGLGGGQPRSAIGASGRPGASPERRRTIPFQGPWPCRAAITGYPRRLPGPVRPRRPRKRPPAASGSEVGGRYKATLSGRDSASSVGARRRRLFAEAIRRIGYSPEIFAAARARGPGDGPGRKRVGVEDADCQGR